MKLRKPETLGLFDHHDRRLGHVDPDFDHRGGNQNLGPASDEGGHRRVALCIRHLTVHQRGSILDGNLSTVIDALITHYQTEKLKEAEAAVQS